MQATSEQDGWAMTIYKDADYSFVGGWMMDSATDFYVATLTYLSILDGTKGWQLGINTGADPNAAYSIT